jgi:hypothetical protein
MDKSHTYSQHHEAGRSEQFAKKKLNLPSGSGQQKSNVICLKSYGIRFIQFVDGICPILIHPFIY